MLDDWFTYITIVIVCICGIVFFVSAFVDIYKNYPKTKLVWKRLASFERHLFKIGVMLSCTIPLVKESMNNSNYISKVLAELFPAIATSVFIVGLVAFVRELHDYELECSNRKEDESVI